MQTELSIIVLRAGGSKMKKVEDFLSKKKIAVEKKTFYLYIAYFQNGFEVNCKNYQPVMVLTMSCTVLSILCTLT